MLTMAGMRSFMAFCTCVLWLIQSYFNSTEDGRQASPACLISASVQVLSVPLQPNL